MAKRSLEHQSAVGAINRMMARLRSKKPLKVCSNTDYWHEAAFYMEAMAADIRNQIPPPVNLIVIKHPIEKETAGTETTTD